jgi:hypothetical protein
VERTRRLTGIDVSPSAKKYEILRHRERICSIMTQQAKRPLPAGATSAFIPGIEGMRALAIIVVLLYHLDPQWTPAGYLGVDLFYVISGFVITRNALQDLAADRFSLKYFYYRRFRRLFPAITVTVLLTVAAGYFVMPPAELAATAKAGVYSLFSLANFNFWWDASYFDAAAHSKPLLHTWSLSLEEQFYLFWPVLLLLAYPTRFRWFLAPGLLLLSLGLAFCFREKASEALFYLLPFRVHQLMCGAVLAIFSLQLPGRMGSVCAMAGGAIFDLGKPGHEQPDTALQRRRHPVAGGHHHGAGEPVHGFHASLRPGAHAVAGPALLRTLPDALAPYRAMELPQGFRHIRPGQGRAGHCLDHRGGGPAPLC